MPERRVGFLLYEFPSPTQTFVVDPIAALLARGVDVRVFRRRLPFTIDPPDAVHGAYERIGWRERTIDLGAEERWSRRARLARLVGRGAGALARDPRGALRLVRRAQRRHRRLRERLAAILRSAPFVGRGLDVLHVHFTWSARGWEDLGELLGVPLVVSAYGADVSLAGEVGRADNAALFAAADRIVCVSRHLAALAVGQGAPAERVRRIPPAIDVRFFSPGTGAPAEPPVVLTVARLVWKKAHLDGLRAIAALRAEGRRLRWRLLGSGPEEPALRAAIADLALGDCVELGGTVGRDAVRDAMREATLFLLPSVREELGVAALEAQACGLPVVATRVGGLAEAVDDGRSGLLVPPRDPSAMARALGALLDDPAARRRMGAHGREHVRRRFAGEGCTSTALPALYEELVAAARARASTPRLAGAPSWTS